MAASKKSQQGSGSGQNQNAKNKGTSRGEPGRNPGRQANQTDHDEGDAYRQSMQEYNRSIQNRGSYGQQEDEKNEEWTRSQSRSSGNTYNRPYNRTGYWNAEQGQDHRFDQSYSDQFEDENEGQTYEVYGNEEYEEDEEERGYSGSNQLGRSDWSGRDDRRDQDDRFNRDANRGMRGNDSRQTRSNRFQGRDAESYEAPNFHRGEYRERGMIKDPKQTSGFTQRGNQQYRDEYGQYGHGDEDINRGNQASWDTRQTGPRAGRGNYPQYGNYDDRRDRRNETVSRGRNSPSQYDASYDRTEDWDLDTQGNRDMGYYGREMNQGDSSGRKQGFGKGAQTSRYNRSEDQDTDRGTGGVAKGRTDSSSKRAKGDQSGRGGSSSKTRRSDS